VFDKTNYSQVYQYDLDDVYDEEAPCDALRRMVISDVRPHDPNEVHDAPSNKVAPPTQENVQEQDQGQHQDDCNDQGRVEDDEDGNDSRPKPPHPRVHQAIQCDHLVENILDDIEKGVTTRSRVSTFCEHYSFISYLEPFKVEYALRDLNWVAM
jgi:hypothetical protein